MINLNFFCSMKISLTATIPAIMLYLAPRVSCLLHVSIIFQLPNRVRTKKISSHDHVSLEETFIHQLDVPRSDRDLSAGRWPNE